MKPATLALIEEGLTSIGARDFLEIFRIFLAVMASPEIARATMATGGFGRTPDEIRRLDERFFVLNGTDHLIEQNARWVRALPILAPMKLERLNQEWATSFHETSYMRPAAKKSTPSGRLPWQLPARNLRPNAQRVKPDV